MAKNNQRTRNLNSAVNSDVPTGGKITRIFLFLALNKETRSFGKN